MKNDRLDDRKLEEIYNRYYAKVYNYFFYRVLDRDLTEDLTSAVFLKVIKKINTFDEKKASFSTWINRIASNVLIDYYRSKKNELRIDAYENHLYVDFEDQRKKLTNEINKMVFDMLTQLTEEERELIYLKFYDEKTNREIARLLGINESTISSRVFRLMKKLKKIFRNGHFEKRVW